MNTFLNFLFNHSPLLYLTQSLWRDEAFSVLIAQPGGIQTINITAADFNPPLYYLLLHYWIKLFGQSEIALRSLSFIFYLILLGFVYLFARKLFTGIWPKITLLLTLLNPMLLYYGLEVRMYSLYVTTTTVSMYFFYTNNWLAYIICTTLALYTQPFSLFISLAQGIYLLLTKKLTKKTIFALMAPILLYLPWLLVIFNQFKNSKQMWIYPIDLNLVTSVLGNLFIGFDGTPGFLWPVTKILSIIFLILFLTILTKKKNLSLYLLFLLWLCLPLFISLGVSVFKPIYVNRYVIPVTVAEIFLLISAIYSLKSRVLKKISTIVLFSISIFFLFFLPPFIKKVDIRKTFDKINQISQKDDLVIAASPLVFFESSYYYKDRTKVFLYNPDRIILPAYLGSILIPPETFITAYPSYPRKAFIIYEDASFKLSSNL